MVAVDSGGSLRACDQWRPAISIALLSSREEPWAQRRPGGGRPGDTEGHLCHAEETGTVPADPTRTAGQRLNGDCPRCPGISGPQNDCATGVPLRPVLRARIGV